MFLLRPSSRDVSVAAGMTTSKLSSAPGLTTSSQNVSAVTVAASFTPVTRTVSVQAL
jgi:hypothetical protein